MKVYSWTGMGKNTRLVHISAFFLNPMFTTQQNTSQSRFTSRYQIHKANTATGLLLPVPLFVSSAPNIEIRTLEFRL